MTRTLRSSLLLALLLIGNHVFAQNGGIAGVVKDSKLGPLINAQVIVTQGGAQKGRALTDYDGNYVVKPLPAGKYSVEVTYQAQRDVTEGVSVPITGLTTVNVNFAPSGGTTLEGAVVTVTRTFRVPLINERQGGGIKTITSEDIEVLPITNTNGIASLGTQAYQSSNNGAVSLGGGRSTGTTYIIDGIQMAPGSPSFTNAPPGSIDQISTITGGVPAKYGDVSGGVIAITSKGATANTRGNLWLEHSVEGYNHNSASFNLSGPLYKRKGTEKDSAGNFVKIPALGYALNGQLVYNGDNSPTYGNVNVLKDGVLAQYQAHPLIPTSSQTGTPFLAYTSEYVTPDQITTRKTNPNSKLLTARGNARLDYSVSDNINLSANGFFGYSKGDIFSRTTTLFAPESQREQRNITGRGYVRFTQRFGNKGGDSAQYGISNASYTVQVDFVRDYGEAYDPDHKFRTFDYGYVGKFVEKFEPLYRPGTDTNDGGRVGIRLLGYVPTGVDFTPSDKNPLLAAYTTDYYNFSPTRPRVLNDIAGGRGLRNGDGPGAVYGLYNNVGSPQSGWSKSRQDQFAASVDAAFDYKSKKGGPRHAFEFGLYYQQRTERSFGVNGAGLWSIMRLLTNGVVSQEVDFSTPYWLVNGNRYTLEDIRNGVYLPSPSDTIFYERAYNRDSLKGFDYNLRQKLGLDSNVYLGIDARDPSTFSLDLFSADELLNGGQNLVDYQGYDYTGQLQTGQVNFNDFWTKRDSRGRLTRPIAAFSPNYIAGYLSDYIEYKDFKITLGMRIDRYDANTKVLRDPYSLYATQKVNATDGTFNTRNGGVHPGNVGSDAVVYVSDATAVNPEIIGYRNGDIWYDFSGKEIEDPTVLKNYSNGRDPQPYLQDKTISRITDTGYKPDESFVDYKPQVNVSPRINFFFPISYGNSGNVTSSFYAHYDILVQRPTPVGVAFATPVDYVTLTQRQGQQTIGNPDLKSEKTVDYEAGFVQQLSSASSVTLTAFYKERRDQIAIRPYLYAYPTTYYTYGNRDFSTTKGFAVAYDLRRTGPLSMTINYTLNYVVGTGSDANSSSGLLTNFISAGLPNLRYIVPLNTDSRHNLNVNVDYRYSGGSNGRGRGPMLFGGHPFADAGANFIFRTRSGEPYTRLAEARTLVSGVQGTNTIIGGLAGNRLPWHYMLDLRVDKNFILNVGRGKGKDMRAMRREGGLWLNAYVRVENLLNTRDVLSVYGYTGRSDDDGFLTSAQGETTVNNQISAETFSYLYGLRANNPGNLNLPRRIWLGLQVNF